MKEKCCDNCKRNVVTTASGMNGIGINAQNGIASAMPVNAIRALKSVTKSDHAVENQQKLCVAMPQSLNEG